MPKKDKAKLISGISDNKPTAGDYHERIDRMNLNNQMMNVSELPFPSAVTDD